MSDQGRNEETIKSKKVRSTLRGCVFTKITFYYVVLFIYLLLGGLFFHLLEGPNEGIEKAAAVRELENLNNKVNSFLISLNISNDTLGNDNVRQLSLYLTELSLNVSSIRSIATSPFKWTFGRSIYFSFISITTIGYGSLAPATKAGRLVLCLYAFLGIPIFLLLVTETSTRFTSLFDWLVLKRVKKERYRWISIIIAIIIGLVALIIIPAAIFTAIESWEYYVSIYFSFVSLSTIGFGDFVLGNNEDAGYRANSNLADFYVITSIVWLYLGLVFLAILIEQVGRGIVKLEKHLAKLLDRFLGGKNKGDENEEKQLKDDINVPTKDLELDSTASATQS